MRWREWRRRTGGCGLGVRRVQILFSVYDSGLDGERGQPLPPESPDVFAGSDLSRAPTGSAKPQVELDVARRQLTIRDGGRFPLTKLEFELRSYLSQ